jgi:hypothetical protein
VLHVISLCLACCAACRRKSYTPRYNPAAVPGTKKKSYWDNLDWDAPLLPFIPDKWYYRVAWLVLIVGVTFYLNWHYGAGSAIGSTGHPVVSSSTGLIGGNSLSSSMEWLQQ